MGFMGKDSNQLDLLGRWGSILAYLAGRYANGKDAAYALSNEEPLLRAELFSADRMEQHGIWLASTHRLTPVHVPNRLLLRLADNEKVLIKACRSLTAALTAKHRITPAGEWLLDNLYLIEEQIRTARHHLPKGYSRELPVLADGPSAGLPQVYDIALETIAHGDGRVDPEGLRRFVKAYQTITALKLGELWAIPIMLRLALIENLRRVALRVVAGINDRDLAVTWAERLIDISRQNQKNLILSIADMARSNPPMTPPFVSELVRRLQGQGPALALPLTWIEQQLEEYGLNIEQLVHAGNQQQAADQVSISNCIYSLRLLSALDWREFVEAMSVVEQSLRTDPSQAYAAMDFTSRDRYRHVVESIAKASKLSELAVANCAIKLAEAESVQHGKHSRTAHVGYYLIDQGLVTLKIATKVPITPATALWQWANFSPLSAYLGAIALGTLPIVGVLLAMVQAEGAPYWLLPPLAALLLLGTGQLAIAIVNWLTTLLVLPRPLPRLDFSKNIPAESRTLVIVPTMLTSSRNVETLIEDLEVRFLANRDPNLLFGLLTDLRDASTETLAEDDSLVRQAQESIHAMNARYATEDSGRFFLFHRSRSWNPHDRIWMGYERKRGKLAALNALIREGNKTGFALLVGMTELLSSVRYVITLDTDTKLPRDAARQLVGAMAHPLNIPVYDPALGRISAGYGILQPRMDVSLSVTTPSLYARMHGGEIGVDPYTRAVSDVYQDAFGEGSFIGKGIYEVTAFEQALKGQLPENRILSHDLLEGCYARAGLLSDVQLYEEYPARYGADVNRRYRWIRGDWQLVGWLLPRVPRTKEQYIANPLSILSRWKLFDNLRRSLTPAALILLLLLGFILSKSPIFWTMVILGSILLPPLLITLLELLHKPNDTRLDQHLAITANAAGLRLVQVGFALMTLPHEAFYSVDAIVRTLWRLVVTHKGLLEWNSSGNQELLSRTNIAAAFSSMAFSPLLAIATTVILTTTDAHRLLIAGPILFLWLGSPLITWWTGRSPTRRNADLTTLQLRFLHRIARKTWAFFETFVGAEDHWLPPDNYQEYQESRVAHRTSPTNMGLALLANLAAYDFGYIPIGQLLDRTKNTLKTMADLDRHRGHFYNWYDTLSLQPLHPAYISTVDSGNLAGHLLTLRAGLIALLDRPIMEPQWLDGLTDTFDVLAAAETTITVNILTAFRHELRLAKATPPSTLTTAKLQLDKFVQIAESIAANYPSDTSDSQLVLWSNRLVRQCQTLRDELIFLVPWCLPSTVNNHCELDNIPTLRTLAALATKWHNHIASTTAIDSEPSQDELRNYIIEGSDRAEARIAAIHSLATQAGELGQMEYSFLYDPIARLLSIGYNLDERRLDSSSYDLLASEARLAVFVAISQGKLPQDSWFALGRLLTSVGGQPTLLSWSGSMFEYLMPHLVMPIYEHTLLDQTAQGAVAWQIKHGRRHGLPWGVSESGYNKVDAQLNYQYRAFGVPGLGLKRGLSDDMVIAPYATALALMVAPESATSNLQHLSKLGAEGHYGFYEAIDYTLSLQRRGETKALIRSYMAHHQGMSLLAFAYLLRDRPMQGRFIADPLLQASLLLLQERIPKASIAYKHNMERDDAQLETNNNPQMPIRVLSTPDTAVPEVQLLSNGRYHVMVTNSGGGYSRWKNLAITRWREDSTRDNWGTFCYLRTVYAGGEFSPAWSTTHQPTLRRGESYEAIFSEGRAEFRRRDGDFDIHTDIIVSPEDDIELRRVRITNCASIVRTIEVTSYAEVVLASPAADALHPTFSNLFVQTEIVAASQAIICTRRPRSQDEVSPWMFHLMAVHDAAIGEISYETDRAQFIGRGRTLYDPLALDRGKQLSGSQGSVLDPIVSIRCQIQLEPGQSVNVDLVYGMGKSRELVLGLIEKYHDRCLADRVFELAWTHAQIVLRQINAIEADAQIYGRMACSIIYTHSLLRAESSILLRNRRGQSGMWGYAISGDLPIVLLRIMDLTNIELVRQLIQAHAYWRIKGLAVDLVIWNEDRAGYRQALHEQILSLVAIGLETRTMDRPGGIFVRSIEQIAEDDRILFQTVAHAIISDSRGTLAEQVGRIPHVGVKIPHFKPSITQFIVPPIAKLPQRDLILTNGIGGFTLDGREYVITTDSNHLTPAPWVNILANPYFGSVISESGQAYTWGENAHEFRLTPWLNDPVSDLSGEAFYLRDEETGHCWSPTPLPMRGAAPYVSRHGFGYSVFEHTEGGIYSELWVYVAIDAAVKFSVLKLHNRSGRGRKLSVTGYVEWILGDLRAKTSMHISTEISPYNGAIIARNYYNTEFSNRVAFFDVDDTQRTVTGDRAEFIGRNRGLGNPAALGRTHLSGRLGTGLDPCAAIQIRVDLAADQWREVTFRLGLGGVPWGTQDIQDANTLVQRFRGSDAARRSLEAVWQYWKHTLGAVQVETPDQSLNVLTNGWLLYQTIACRMWARSGYYQSGGAFGFRDQLQDAMALVHTEPGLLRDQLLLCASRQFPDGDVQHWWHPPVGRGVRTHCSDDFLWLVAATCRYVLTTGDTGVLKEPVPFLEGRPLDATDESYYDLPGHSEGTQDLYHHCVLAIRQGLGHGEHGLPLIGSGDWNDGMNRVGIQGKGESVWLGFFLYQVLRQFSTLARMHDKHEFADFCIHEAKCLNENLEQHGWDGAWYRRAWFDDGNVLGSADNLECRIDSISQSWAVLSQAGNDTRTRQAMQAVDDWLVDRDHALIQLLAPPFDKTLLDPGYIKGYVPGVRENGGQYTHAAIWAAMAFAALGDNRRAWELTTMINPANHANSVASMAIYKVEPYVMSADIYAVAPHNGRGGWTWYTGSAGWMYRLILESLLGLRLEVDRLHITPCLPTHWDRFSIHYRFRETVYHLVIVQARSCDDRDGCFTQVMRIIADGVECADKTIHLADDRREHGIEVLLTQAME